MDLLKVKQNLKRDVGMNFELKNMDALDKLKYNGVKTFLERQVEMITEFHFFQS